MQMQKIYAALLEKMLEESEKVLEIDTKNENMSIDDAIKKLAEINTKLNGVSKHVKSGDSFRKRKKYDKALKEFSKAQAIMPECAIPYMLQGMVKYEMNDFEGAIKDLTKSIAINQSDSNEYYVRGMSKAKLGMHNEAKEDLDKAIELNANEKLFYERRAEVHEKLGMNELAQKDREMYEKLNRKV